jgi:diguanylate cyclase (GGDEF)-like protein/PAS domain S-box-containing protein
VARAAYTPAMFVANLDGDILTWSKECEELTGYLSAEATQLSMDQFLRPHRYVASQPPSPALGAPRGRFSLACKNRRAMMVDVKTTRCGLADDEVMICSIESLEGIANIADTELTLANMIEGLPCLFYILDQHGQLIFGNARLAEAVELDVALLARVDAMTFFPPEDRQEIRAVILKTFEHGSSRHESTIVGRHGKRTPFLFQCARVLINGEPCIFGTGSDISERKEAEMRLKVNQSAMDACVNAIVITRVEGDSNVIEYVNPAFTRITGYSVAEAVGRDPGFMRAGNLDQAERKRIDDALGKRESVHAVLRNARKNGEIFWNNLRIDPVVTGNGPVTHFVAVIDDVTEARKYEETLRHLATHDTMTGLANRAVLHDRLQGAIERAIRDDSCVAVIYLDLDDFKAINDNFGHEAGDVVLKSVAQRLLGSVRAGDTVARIGGDEFVAVVNECQGIDHMGELVGRLHQCVIDPIDTPGHEVLPSVSIGVSLYPHDGADSGAILRAADAAMYRAKATGKNQFKFYSADIDQSVHNHLARESSLRAAIERSELFLGYQPKVDLSTGKMVGAEALVRWNHPLDGVVMPDAFIQLAEESGLIVPLGEWVLRQACEAIQAIRAAGYPAFTMSVNLSVRQLRRPEFIGTVARLLADFHVAAGAIELEVTESHLMDNPQHAVQTLEQLKALGVQLSIDDFGTGYSSLSRLKKFPVDYIKIDRSFLGELHQSGDSVIAQAIISLGHKLNIKVIAEGVETKEQLQFLREHRCDQIQGYLFSPAISQPALLNMLAANVTLQ